MVHLGGYLGYPGTYRLVTSVLGKITPNFQTAIFQPGIEHLPRRGGRGEDQHLRGHLLRPVRPIRGKCPPGRADSPGRGDG